jgi:excisionase family DNA binding protein
MIRRSTQLGARENTASSRQHASRLVDSSSPLRPDRLSQSLKEKSRSLVTPKVQPVAPFAREPHNRATGEERVDRDPLLTIKEVAELLRVPISWVYGRTRKRALDRLPGYRLGKYWRFSENEVLAWVKCQHGGPRAT